MNASESIHTSPLPATGFTLVELLVVILVIGILTALLLPVLNKGKGQAQQTYCLDNGKQIMVALTMYAADHQDLFPPNPDDGNTVPGHNWCSGAAGIGQPAEFNPDLLQDQTRSLLSTYLHGNVTVFHCPADLRTGKYQGTQPALMGKTVPAARTFSMNQAVGAICPGFDSQPESIGGKFPPHIGVPNLPVNGPWLNDQHNNISGKPWLTYYKTSAIQTPGPASLWIFIDEDTHFLNDAAFAFGMEIPQWIDVPGTYHNGGCGFAYADGHSESHTWASQAPKIGDRTMVANKSDMQDWLWMRERTSAYASGPMPPPK